MVFDFIKKHKSKAPDKVEGPDPFKIRQLLEQHPSFQVLTVDGLKWIDPHTLTSIDCPFGYIDTALEWMMQEKPWHTHACRNLKEIRIRRWLLHIKDNLDLDERWRLFANDGVWLNPYTAQWEKSVTSPDRKISRETLTLMARSMVEYPENRLKEMKDSNTLALQLAQRNGSAPQTEAIIKATKKFTPSHAKHANHTKNRQQKPAAPQSHNTSDENSANDATLEFFSQDAADLQDTSNITLEISSALQAHAPTKNTHEHSDLEQTMDIDFAQGSLMEPPSESKPLKQKKTQTFHKEKAAPVAGDQIAGYKITGFLGKGGMGDVHKAVQMSMQREVAIKILPRELCRDEAFANRFIREARAAGKVNHPNVITCFDVGNDQGVLYMALELVTGGDVLHLLKSSGGSLSIKRSLRIMTDCARGLGAIYKAGLIHRDIKPANIFLSDDGVAKLADLGLARSSANNTQMTQAGACIGTPAYMSPEQVKGQDDLDIRSDIYALGVTLYTMLCGKNPFKAKDVWALFRMIIQDDTPDIRNFLPDLDPAIVSIIDTCLQKNPEERYQTPYGLLAALDEI